MTEELAVGNRLFFSFVNRGKTWCEWPCWHPLAKYQIFTNNQLPVSATSGLYYKHIVIVNYNSSIINKFGASLIDDARVIIYDCHMFIVQETVSKTLRLIVSLRTNETFDNSGPSSPGPGRTCRSRRRRDARTGGGRKRT